MAKKVVGQLKLQIKAQEATPSPPVGPALGQRGINIMEFCKAFNAKTQEMVKGSPVPVVITYYADKSFTFETKTPPASFLLKKAAGLKPVPTGIDHGTITVVAKGTPFEVTTFRRDVETDGRNAIVAFSDQIEDDAARRDFTMNALYADASGQVLDPVGGLPDLHARTLRFVGSPAARIRSLPAGSWSSGGR